MPTAPAFWWADRPTLAAHLLRPLGSLYGAAAGWRMQRPGTTLPVPVLCVGNLVAGGAGKTPTALALAEFLATAGHRPAFLSRGYGRSAEHARAAVLRVDRARHTAAEAGDEPLLLAAAAPTYVSADRVAAGRRAAAEGATILVLDDGLQNPALTKTLSVAVVDGAAGCGNWLCIPAGPLRAPLATQWPLVAAVCMIGEGHAGDRVARAAETWGRAVLRGRLEPDAAVLAVLRERPVLAFAGIGRPGKFFETLAIHGVEVAARHTFPDHHRFTADDLLGLEREAAAQGARLATTSKDHARLPSGFPGLALPVSLRFDDADAVEHFLRPLVGLLPRPDDSHASPFAKPRP